MEPTITQNGALYALLHRAANQHSNNAQIKPARARKKTSAPEPDANPSTSYKIETEEKCFISSGT
jgi:hypothetical protein